MMGFYARISGKDCRGGSIPARGLRSQGQRAPRKSILLTSAAKSHRTASNIHITRMAEPTSHRTERYSPRLSDKSISLGMQNGHMFTLYIRGLHALDVAKTARDAEGVSVSRSVIDFQIEPTAEAINFVGRWLDINKLRVSEPDATVGPRHLMVDPDGVRTDAILVASPHAMPRHVAIPRGTW